MGEKTWLIFAWHDSFICVICFIESCPSMGEYWVMFSNGWRDMTLLFVWHDSFICVICFTHLRDVTHPFEGRDSPIWGTWLTHLRDVTQYYVGPCCRSFMCVIWLIHVYLTWLIHVCGMAHSCVWHDSFMCVAWLDYMCDMTLSCVTHWCVWHDWFICFTWLDHMRDTPPSYVWHHSFICMTRLMSGCDIPQPSMGHDSMQRTAVVWRIHVWRDSSIAVTCLIHISDSFTYLTYSQWRASFTYLSHSNIWLSDVRHVLHLWLSQKCSYLQYVVIYICHVPNSHICLIHISVSVTWGTSQM